MNNLFGLNIVSHPLATRTERVARIERSRIAKRRRRWTLRYETRVIPCAFQVGSTVYMHPSLIEKLKGTKCNSGFPLR